MDGAEEERLAPLKINYGDIEQYSQSCLSVQQICTMMDITKREFAELKRNDEKFRKALDRGRTMSILSCSQVVLRAAQGENLDSQQVDAAKLFLEKHSGNWR